MLMNMQELLTIAQKHHFAIPAFNIGSLEILNAVKEESEALQAPVIYEIHPDELAYLKEPFMKTVLEVAHTTSVPCVIHLDHGANRQQILQALRCGFTSVMIDASSYPLDENIRRTKDICELVKPQHVSVEAELGTIGAINKEHVSDIQYSDPVAVKTFVDKTGVDTLAVAIGTAHGIYPTNYKPTLRLDVLKAIHEQVNIPLVLHGGSSNPDEEIAQAVALGICKINISSDVKTAFFTETKRYLALHPDAYEPNAIFPSAIQAARSVIANKMRLLNTVGKAYLYK